MPVKIMINEIMWEYNCSKKAATKLVNKYRKQGKYFELCNIVKFKRYTPEF